MIFCLLFFLTIANAENLSTELCNDCTCTNTSQILTINCVRKGFNEILQQWPKHNTTIKVLFSENNIPTLGPLPQTDAVIEIVLSNCQIQYLESGVFANTKNIRFVDLSHNLLTAEEMSEDKLKGRYNNTIYEPIALENLDLSYNRIHSLNKNIFEHMPNLKTLNLEGNDFKILDIHTQLALSSLKGLQSLNLANNELTEVVKYAIQGFENLTELNLSNNLLDFVPSSLVHVGKSLEIVNLDGNPIIEFTDETFFGLGNVNVLSANNLTKLKYINANTFTPMSKLKKLSLCNNLGLKDIDREAFGINQTIEEFYLNNNELYRLDYKLLPWSKLRVFEFKENPFDCSCDLYNITNALSDDITRSQDGPYCWDDINHRSIRAIELKSDICLIKGKYQREHMQYHFSLIRMILIILSVIIMMTAFLAAVLGYFRYRKYHRTRNYPFASQIVYNPLSTKSSRY